MVGLVTVAMGAHSFENRYNWFVLCAATQIVIKARDIKWRKINRAFAAHHNIANRFSRDRGEQNAIAVMTSRINQPIDMRIST